MLLIGYDYWNTIEISNLGASSNLKVKSLLQLYLIFGIR